jgi:hypothetical protein
VSIPDKLSNLFAINWLYGFISSIIIFYVLHKLFPDHSTLIPSTIYGDEVARGTVDELDTNNDNIADKGVQRNATTEITDKEE